MNVKIFLTVILGFFVSARQVQQLKTGLRINNKKEQLIVYLADNSIQSLRMYSLSGKQVRPQVVHASTKKATLNVSSLKANLYFIVLTNVLNQRQTFNFIKK